MVGIEFMKPFWLWLFPLLAFLVFFISRRGSFNSKFAGRIHTGVRLFVCLLIVLAMASPQIIKRSDITSTIVLLDDSASADGSEWASFIEEMNEARNDKDSLGMVVFGKTAGVELLPDEEAALPVGGLMTYIDEGATNIGAALRLAGGIFPDGAAKRAVLLSDGEENIGDALLEARALAAEGVTVDVYPLEQEIGDEVQLTSITLPETINKDMEYEIALEIASTIDTSLQVRLYKGNTLIGNENVSVTAGESRIVFADTTSQGGNVVYRGEIIPQSDSISENNKAYAYTYIEDVPRVLIIGEEDETQGWQGILSAAALDTDIITPIQAPSVIEDLQGYDSVILANVDITELSEEFITVLESYIRTLGGGLVVSGGDHSFALGGYYNTLLEEMLPVEMEIKTEGEQPDLAMIMMIDRSGSMSGGNYGVTQLEMAKEAAIRSLDGFSDNDSVGIIAFDDGFEWAVPMTKVGGNKEAIIEGIGNIQLGGGTSILPGLTEAVDTLSSSDAKEKHIILLTDGQAEQNGYESPVNKMKENGITLSSIAVGDGSDTRLLSYLAENGGGRYYYTDEFTDLPSVFAKETILAGKEYLNNRDFYPKEQDPSQITAEIEAVPSLQGYVSATGKPRGNMVLVSDEDEPVLATWQYGLGRTAVWTPDVGGGWTEEWLADTTGVEVLRNTLSWAMNTQIAKEMKLTAEAAGESSILRLEMPFDDTVTEIRAQVVNAAGETYATELTVTAPGVYEGAMETAEEGAYGASILIERENGETESYQAGFTLSYPAEYDITQRGTGIPLLNQIAASGGGRVLKAGSEVFDTAPSNAYDPKDITDILLILGVIVFLADIALRRFSFIPSRMEQFFDGKIRVYRERAAKETKKPALPKKQEAKPVNEEKIRRETDKPHEKTTAEKLAEARKKRGN